MSWEKYNSVVCFACKCNSKVSEGLSNSGVTTQRWDNLALFGARLFSAYSRPFHCVSLHHTGMSCSHVHVSVSLCSFFFCTYFAISSDWILSLCLSLTLSVGWLNISAWFGVRVFFGGWEYFDYLHEIPCLFLCTWYRWNWQLQGDKWMPPHFRGRIISCNYPKSA